MNHYVYAIEEKYWLILLENKSFKIAMYKWIDIKENDKIFIYIKKIGFVAYGTVKNLINNSTNKIRVFKDNNMQKFVIEFKSHEIFKNTVSLSTVCENINTDKFKSIQWFSSKYAKGNCLLNLLEKDIAQLLLAVLNNYKNIKIEKQIKPKKTKERKSKKCENEEENQELESNDQIQKSDNSENEEEPESNDEKEKSDDSENQEQEEHKFGYIPILIILCKKFKFPQIECDENEIDDLGNTEDTREKIKYFKNHIKKCNDCDIINNNNSNFMEHLTGSLITFDYIKQDGYEYEAITQAYFGLNKYNSFGDDIEDHNFKICYVDHETSIYHKQIFLTWANKSF